MTATEISNYVASAKQQGFTPTQVRMQLAMRGANNASIQQAIPSATMWMVKV